MLETRLQQFAALRQVILSYLTGERSMDELEEYLVGNLQDILDSGEQAAIDVANEVDALLIQFGEGLLAEDQLKARFTVLLSEMHIPSMTTGACNTITVDTPVVSSLPTFIRVSHSFAQVAGGK